MKLICVNAELAGVYGLPPKDVDEKDALALLEKQGLGAAHLDSAIAAGAFKRPVDVPKTATSTGKTITQVSKYDLGEKEN